MLGIKVCSAMVFLAAADVSSPLTDTAWEKFGAYGLAAFCVYQMWNMIQRREIALKEKDNQINRMITVMEQKPCLHGQLPAPKVDPAQPVAQQ